MSTVIRTQFRLENLVDGSPAHGGIPSRTDQVATDSRLTSQSVQVVGTTHSAIEVGNVDTNAMLVLSNMDETATILVGADDATVFVPWFSIPPGSPPAVLPLLADATDVYLKSDEADSEVLVSLYKIEVAP